MKAWCPGFRVTVTARRVLWRTWTPPDRHPAAEPGKAATARGGYLQTDEIPAHNQNTCFNQRPIVRRETWWRKARSRRRPGTAWRNWPGQERHGGLHALGRYNFEDSILVSERLIKDDVFTSSTSKNSR